MVLWYDLLLLSGLTAEIKIKKMRSSEKALNTLGSYVKKKRRKNTEILYFSNSVAIEISHALKRFAKTLSY